MHVGRNELKWGIILNYVNMGIGNLIPIFYTPIMLSILGQNEYGLYKLSSSITGYLGLISLGLGSAVTRYLIKAKTEEGQEAEEQMLGLFLVIFRVIAFISFIVGLLLTLNLHCWYGKSLNFDEINKMKVLVFIMVCNTALSFSVAPYISIVTARERFLFYQCMNIILTCVAPLVNLVALILGYASVGMAISTLIVAVIVRVIYYIYVRKSLGIKPKFSKMPTRCLREIAVFSFWIFIGNIVEQLYNATDTLMIGAIPTLATTGVAVYTIGCVFNTMILNVTAGVSNLLVPRTNRMVFSGASSKEITDYCILIGRLQTYLYTTIVSAFIVFGKPLIHFYVGDSYQESYWIALFIILPHMIPLSQSACLSIIIAKNQHKFRSLTYLSIAIINVIGTWFALQRWGIIGAALITGLAMLIGHGICMNWFYWKRSEINLPKFWNSVAKVLMVPSSLCLAALFFCQHINLYNFWVLAVFIFFFLAILFILQWFFAMNDYERRLVATPYNKLFRKNV